MLGYLLPAARLCQQWGMGWPCCCPPLKLPLCAVHCVPDPHAVLYIVYLAPAACPAVHAPTRPVPNLGYACLNNTLQQQKPMVSPQAGAHTTSEEAKQMPAPLPFPARQGFLGSVQAGLRVHTAYAVGPVRSHADGIRSTDCTDRASARSSGVLPAKHSHGR